MRGICIKTPYLAKLNKIYRDFVKLLDAKVVVELGTGWGHSTAAFTSALKNTGGMLYSVDLDFEELSYKNIMYASFQSRTEITRIAHKNNPYVEFIKGDSVEVGKKWDKGDIDILLCDTDHTYKTVSAELETWDVYNPMIIFVHDTYHNGGRTAPCKAAEDFAKRHKRLFVNHRFRNGLAIIYRDGIKNG